MKHWFLGSRLSAIWQLLTKRYFVVVTANDDGDLSSRFNVNHRSFRLLMRVLDPTLAQLEAEADLLKQADDILKKPTL